MTYRLTQCVLFHKDGANTTSIVYRSVSRYDFVCRVLCDVYRVLCDVYRVLCDVYRVLCDVYRVLCDVYRVLCDVYRVLCDVYRVCECVCVSENEPKTEAISKLVSGSSSTHLASIFQQNVIHMELQNKCMFPMMTCVCSSSEYDYRSIIHSDTRFDSKAVLLNML